MTLPGEFKQAIVQYRSDTGTVFGIRQKRSIALALNNQIVEILEPQGYPQRWKLRYVTIQTLYHGELFSRTEIIGNPNNPIFRGSQKTVTIDGVTWRVVARKGESMRGPRHY